MVAAADYIATDAGEASLVAGEALTVEERADSGWVYVKTAAGAQGWVPKGACLCVGLGLGCKNFHP